MKNTHLKFRNLIGQHDTVVCLSVKQSWLHFIGFIFYNTKNISRNSTRAWIHGLVLQKVPSCCFINIVLLAS